MREGESERESRQTNATCVEYHLRKMLNTLSENEMERQRKREGVWERKTSAARGGTRLKVKNKSNKKGSKADGERAGTEVARGREKKN